MKTNQFINCLLISFCAITGCNSNHDVKAKNLDSPDTIAFIHPPLKGVDIPFEHFSFLAEQGDTIFATSGSMLLFPPNSIVDKNGKPVNGKIDISYREFSDPADFFISGIPMDYEENGTKYIFESSAMCELRAHKDDEPVFVNKENKPRVNLLSRNADTAHNLYMLDTDRKKWIVKGKDAITLPQDKGQQVTSENQHSLITSSSKNLIAPVRPQQASAGRPVISIEVDSASVQELMSYNNLRFEIDKHDKNWDPKYAAEEWSDVKLEKTKQHGLYLARFANAKQKVSFLARPVFEGQDYEEAMRIFEKKNKEYQALKTARLNTDKIIKKELDSQRKALLKEEKARQAVAKETYLKHKEAFETSEKLIREENKRIAKLNAPIEKRIREREERNRRAIASYLVAEAVLRSFEIDGFGVWNCDKPILQQTAPLYAKFKDKSGKYIELENIAVVYKNLNGIARYSDNNIRILPGSGNMIWAICDKQLFYLTFDQFSDCNISGETGEYTFTMLNKPATKDSYAALKELLKPL